MWPRPPSLILTSRGNRLKEGFDLEVNAGSVGAYGSGRLLTPEERNVYKSNGMILCRIFVGAK